MSYTQQPRQSAGYPPPASRHFDSAAYNFPKVGGWGWAIFFLGWIGGLIGYFSLKPYNPRRASHVAKWGFIWTGIWAGSWIVISILISAAAAGQTGY